MGYVFFGLSNGVLSTALPTEANEAVEAIGRLFDGGFVYVVCCALGSADGGGG